MKKKSNLSIYHVIFILFLFFCFYLYKYKKIITDYFLHKRVFYETVMGDFYIEEPIIQDAIKNGALLRMKKIDQGGPLVYFNQAEPFSRYDHCVGVWALLKRFNASTEEQLVGLWHDISHTAFSHVADFIFRDGEKSEYSYQDGIHLWYLKNSKANNIITQYNLDLKSLDPDNGNFSMLERPLPEMCADRIEYNLHTAYAYKIFTKEDINLILSHLHYDLVSYDKNGFKRTEKNWYFDDIESAKKFAFLPLYFMKTIWNAPFNIVFYKFFSELMKYSFDKNYISKNMFHFGTDEEILAILSASKDLYVRYLLDCLKNANTLFEVIDNTDQYDECIISKFRGINPFVKINDKPMKIGNTKNVHETRVKRLTDVDKNFNYFYKTVEKESKKGIKIKYKKNLKNADSSF